MEIAEKDLTPEDCDGILRSSGHIDAAATAVDVEPDGPINAGASLSFPSPAYPTIEGAAITG
jgi:hypothetical protein